MNNEFVLWFAAIVMIDSLRNLAAICCVVDVAINYVLPSKVTSVSTTPELTTSKPLILSTTGGCDTLSKQFHENIAEKVRRQYESSSQFGCIFNAVYNKLCLEVFAVFIC